MYKFTASVINMYQHMSLNNNYLLSIYTLNTSIITYYLHSWNVSYYVNLTLTTNTFYL